MKKMKIAHGPPCPECGTYMSPITSTDPPNWFCMACCHAEEINVVKTERVK